jgi:hypothetical protein
MKALSLVPALALVAALSAPGLAGAAERRSTGRQYRPAPRHESYRHPAPRGYSRGRGYYGSRSYRAAPRSYRYYSPRSYRYYAPRTYYYAPYGYDGYYGYGGYGYLPPPAYGYGYSAPPAYGYGYGYSAPPPPYYYRPRGGVYLNFGFGLGIRF